MLNNNSTKVLAPGVGFSADTQQLVDQICYQVNGTIVGAPSSDVQLSTAFSFTDFESQLGISIDASGGFGMFAGGGAFDYLRNIKDTSYSMSLNYYEISSAEIAIQFNGIGAENVLNPSGMSFYNNGTDPLFGIWCGDYIVTSYESGAMLLMGMKLEFASSFEKEQFTASAGTSFGDIFSASGKVQSVVQSLGLKGQVTLQAYQVGGEPNELSQILSKDSSGSFYILTCDLQNMNACTSAASGLLSYAQGSFSSQFSFSPQNNIYSLNNKFDYKPIAMFELNTPPSLVTPEVTAARTLLAEVYNANQYYQENLYNIQNGYPVALDTGSAFYTSMTNFSTVVNNNLNLLLSTAGDPTYQAINCYNLPQECVQTASNIMAKIGNITASDLGFLSAIQYIYPLANPHMNDILYPTGSSYNWVQTGGPLYILSVSELTITPTNFYMTGSQRNPDGSGPGFTIQTNSIDANNYYVSRIDHWHTDTGSIPRFDTSPFFFAPYSNEDVSHTLGGVDSDNTVQIA